MAGLCLSVVALAAGSLRLPSLGLPCLFHQLTGLYCPGCGSTRALRHLIRGEPIAAIGSNPLLAVTVPFLLLAIVEPRLTGPWRAGPRKVLQSPITGWGLVVVSVLFTVLRNLPFGAFRWLAP